MKQPKRPAVVKGIAALVLVILLAVFAFLLIGHLVSSNATISSLLSQGSGNVIQTAANPIEKLIALQSDIDEMLLAELDSGYYSPQEPLVVVNPYGNSPLTALILFQTDDAAQVSIHIPGTIPQTAIDYTFTGYQTHHILPVYGLYAQTVNQVELSIVYESGASESITVPIETEALDSALDALLITTTLTLPEQYASGLNFSYNSSRFKYTLAFDAEGMIRLQLQTAASYKILSHPKLTDYNGHFLQIAKLSETSFVLLEINPLGRIYRAIALDYGKPHHDMLSIDDGDRLLILCNAADSITAEDRIVELDMVTGQIVHVMDLKDILQTSRNLPPDYDTEGENDLDVVDEDADPFHVNTIIAIDGSDDIIISPRNQNQVLRLSWPDGEIRWIAGDPTGISPMYEQYYLTPVGENFSYFYRQHAPSIMADLDNDPDTIDLLLFDNGTTRNEYDSSITQDDLYSRMVHYRINEKEMTIELIREYGKEYGQALYSTICGNAEEMDNGNWLGMFDVSVGSTLIDYAPAYVEINENNELVWMMQYVTLNTDSTDAGIGEYHVERITLYNDAANDLQLGSDPLVVLKQ